MLRSHKITPQTTCARFQGIASSLFLSSAAIRLGSNIAIACRNRHCSSFDCLSRTCSPGCGNCCTHCEQHSLYSVSPLLRRFI